MVKLYMYMYMYMYICTCTCTLCKHNSVCCMATYHHSGPVGCPHSGTGPGYGSLESHSSTSMTRQHETLDIETLSSNFYTLDNTHNYRLLM